MNQKLLIIGNWKCNPTTKREAERLFLQIKRGTREVKNIEVVISPPFVYLSCLKEKLRKLKKSNLKFGAQDCFWERKGAFTGGISPLMLRDLGVEYVILGHSERRKYFKETDEIILKKIKSALRNRLSPILCIGETEKERKEGKTNEVLKTQLKNTLQKLFKPKISLPSSFAVAYEPVWAIGTGNFCPPELAMKALMFIKKEIIKVFPREISQAVRILYGGSVDSKNAIEYIKVGFSGFIVGGASLKAPEFIKIIELCNIIK